MRFSPRRFFGQATLEMLAIFGGLMLLILLVAVTLPDQMAGVQNVRAHAMAQEAVSQVARTADDIYLAGDGASARIWIEMPNGFDANASRSFLGARPGEGNWSLRKMANLNLPATGDVFALSRAPLCGAWPGDSGRYRINISYNASGTAHVMVNSQSC